MQTVFGYLGVYLVCVVSSVAVVSNFHVINLQTQHARIYVSSIRNPSKSRNIWESQSRIRKNRERDAGKQVCKQCAFVPVDRRIYIHTHNENSITHILTHAHTAGHTHVRTKNMHTHAYTCVMTSRFRSAVISSCVRVDVKDSSVRDYHIFMYTYVIRILNFKENTVLVSPKLNNMSSSIGARTSHAPSLQHRC